MIREIQFLTTIQWLSVSALRTVQLLEWVLFSDNTVLSVGRSVVQCKWSPSVYLYPWTKRSLQLTKLTIQSETETGMHTVAIEGESLPLCNNFQVHASMTNNETFNLLHLFPTIYFATIFSFFLILSEQCSLNTRRFWFYEVSTKAKHLKRSGGNTRERI